jgi:homoserine kinase
MSAPMFRAQAVRVRVPASIANLGPGFDTFGLAVGLHDDVVAQVTDEPGLTVEVAGEGVDELRTDERHLVVRAMRAAFKDMGGQPRGLALICANRIPHGRGLGSSAAAIVAGLVAARWLTVGGEERLPDERLLEMATALEGHADNVAAALLGGFTLAWCDGGSVSAVRLPVAPGVVPVALVPVKRLATSKARRLLPEVVPHADAAFNVARAGLLVHALSADPTRLLAATEDRLHQAQRTAALPKTAALLAKLRADGVAAVVAGSGPAVLALATPAQVDGVQAMTPTGWTSLVLEISDGATAEGFRHAAN